MNRLDELAEEYGTDKGPSGHGYTTVYFDRLSHLTSRRFKMLEIGVLFGASMRMWEEFFPLAEIRGIDIDSACSAHTAGRVSIDIVDQGSKADMQAYADREGGFKLVVDDGGHRMHQQILSFEVLFPTLLPGGMYIVEDTHTSYVGLYGGGDGKKLTTVKYFHALTDKVNTRTEAVGVFAEPVAIADIVSVEFLKGLVLVRKARTDTPT